MRRLLKSFLNLLSIFSVVIKRLRHHLGLTISSEIGIICVLSLVICVPVFTKAVLSDVLMQELTAKAVNNHRSLFSIHAYYMDDTIYTPLTLENARSISRYINYQLTDPMGLKVDNIYLEFTTESFYWKPIKYKSSKQPFDGINLSIMGNDIIPGKTVLVEGEWPPSSITSEPISNPIPVAVYEEFADNNFLNVGDIYQSGNLEIKIVGIFRAIDPNDLSWFYSPETTFRKEGVVPIEYFQELLPAVLKRPTNYTSWYAIVNDQSLRFNNSLSNTQAMVRLDSDLHTMLPQITIDYSPVDKLKDYETRLRSLITLFYVTGAPLVLLALIFISLTASIAVQQVDQETTTMRGRGVSLFQVYALNLCESLALIFIAAPFSLLLGWLSAILMGQTQLFLQFTRRSVLAYSLKDINLVWLGVLSLIIIAARLSPLLSLRHTTAVSIKQERSRSAKKPLWERFYLDFLLLIPAVYAYWVMKGNAKPIKVLTDLKLSSSEGQYDPLMFMASSLFAIAACMIALRIFPFLMRLLAAISDRLSRVGSYMAIQEIARRSREHASVMLLIMISLSLAIFSASMAKTLDQWMHDSQYYQTGADLVVKEYEIPISGSSMGGGSSPQQAQPNANKGVESLISVEKHLKVPGIQSATYVGKYNGHFSYSVELMDCVLMGIDRLSFPNTAYYRHDFASQSLGALMNALGGEPKGVLVPLSLLKSTGLSIGDRLKVSAPVGMLDEGFSEEMVIVGTYTYFPTVYPEDIPTLIVNLATLFGSPEAATGYDVWLNIQNKANVQAILDQLKGLAFKDLLFVDVRGNALQQIQKLINQPEWVGLFGILSVGFLLTGLMTCIGFVLDSFASLRKHFIQLGILQAIGLATSQLINYLVLERLLLMGIAIAFGAVFGFLTSVMFVPLLQISAAPGTPIPPFEVLIGWVESTWLILAFGVVLLIAVIGMITYLVQIKIFQAVKLGESI